MRRAAFAGSVASLFALSGCGGNTESGGSGSAALSVDQTYDQSAGLYIEGAISYVAVETSAGDEIAEEQLESTNERTGVTITLEPGEYVLRSWQRPCSGNCGELDKPTDRCESPFSLGPNGSLLARIVVRAGEGCSITFE